MWRFSRQLTTTQIEFLFFSYILKKTTAIHQLTVLYFRFRKTQKQLLQWKHTVNY